MYGIRSHLTTIEKRWMTKLPEIPIMDKKRLRSSSAPAQKRGHCKRNKKWAAEEKAKK